MGIRLMSLTLLQIAKMFGVVREVRPVCLAGGDRRRWSILVNGLGFQRLLKADLFVMPGAIRMSGWYRPRPVRFVSERLARRFARQMGLI